MTGKANNESAAVMEARIRREIGDILVAEYTYWRNSDNEQIAEFAMGAMGGVSNVLAAVIMSRTPEHYRKSIEERNWGTVA